MVQNLLYLMYLWKSSFRDNLHFQFLNALVCVSLERFIEGKPLISEVHITFLHMRLCKYLSTQHYFLFFLLALSAIGTIIDSWHSTSFDLILICSLSRGLFGIFCGSECPDFFLVTAPKSLKQPSGGRRALKLVLGSFGIRFNYCTYI